jgi:hypothetical protein
VRISIRRMTTAMTGINTPRLPAVFETFEYQEWTIEKNNE